MDCKICNIIMTPIIYGSVTPDLIYRANCGELIIGDPKAIDKPHWYCNTCTEAF